MNALQVRTGRIFCVPDVCQDDSAVHNEGKFCGWRRGGLWLPNISRAPINSSIVASLSLCLPHCAAPLSLMDNQRTHCESYMATAERKRKKLPAMQHRVRFVVLQSATICSPTFLYYLNCPLKRFFSTFNSRNSSLSKKLKKRQITERRSISKVYAPKSTRNSPLPRRPGTQSRLITAGERAFSFIIFRVYIFGVQIFHVVQT